MRVYKRYTRKHNIITHDYFATFSPKNDNIYFNRTECSIINNLIDKDINNTARYGSAKYDIRKKIWLFPYGNQIDFMKTINDNKYKPFMDTRYLNLHDYPGILHYIGFFPHNKYHQIYYYFKEFNKEHMDDIFSQYEADYFGTSLTFDENWNVVKKNSYAQRVIYDVIKDTIDERFSIKTENIKYINLSSSKNILTGEYYTTCNHLLYKF